MIHGTWADLPIEVRPGVHQRRFYIGLYHNEEASKSYARTEDSFIQSNGDDLALCFYQGPCHFVLYGELGGATRK